MKMSATGSSNTLPSFLFQAGSEEGGSLYGGFNFSGGVGTPTPFYMPVQNCPDELYANESPDLRVPQLPWRLQNDWGCERAPSEVPVIVLENDWLRAAITPQWGSKVWSLYHKKERRQLVYNNPAHQPSNIGYRKAWTSGGAEWNWAPGKIGHSVFSESSSYLAKIQTERGIVVRAWEYDRLNHTVWSVDILLDGETLWAHPRIYNYDSGGGAAVDVPGYWWTCVAMRTTDNTRVVTPAAMSVTPCTPWPHGAWTLQNSSFRGSGSSAQCPSFQSDQSYIGNIPASHDFFFYIPRNTTPHVTHVSDDGYSFVHTHAPEVRGTKFFQWGKDASGQFMQDFMSASDYENRNCTAPYYDPWCEHFTHDGDYTELQVGPAPTQMHVFPIAGNTSYEWTESFKGFWANVSRIHSPNYSHAVDEVAEWMASKGGLPQSEFLDMDGFFDSLAEVAPAPGDILYQGMPWGGLREMLLASRPASEGEVRLVPHGACPFSRPEYTQETRPWIDLIVNGTFSRETLSLTPASFEVDALWVEVLDESLRQHNETWLHHLFLGTHSLEVGNVESARISFMRSLALQPSAHAYRNLAIFAPTADQAASLFFKAWEQWKTLDPTVDAFASALGRDLSSEIAAWLMLNERWEQLRRLFADLPSEYLTKDRVIHSNAALAVHDKDWQTAIRLLTGHCFPTYGSERGALIDLWWEAQVLEELARTSKSSLTQLELVRLRRRLGCDGDTTSSTVMDKCTRGPPNLGLRYGGF
eukprot:TRINITY_DN2741_c0_g2_i2.p1 TRINITY_DN2741_c0_g2~~TRINITY_DN2741_c0_g2_i2.p1  ORF type:complete len:753 (-),score=124.49 TRINITY_DN2741_c0_g2_i2:115-2373(-)